MCIRDSQQLQLAEDKEKLQQQADALSAKIEKKLAESTDEIIRRDSKPIQPGKPLLRGSAAGTAEDPLYLSLIHIWDVQRIPEARCPPR